MAKESGLSILSGTIRRSIEASELEVFDAPEGVRVVTLRSDEGTSMCPITAQPDYWSVTIEYQPRQWCVETKSLKLYLWSYRDRGIFCEAIASQIADDLATKLAPRYLLVTVTFKVRGGIEIESKAWKGAE